MSYPIDIEAQIAMAQQICELTGNDAGIARFEGVRALYTLINEAYDSGCKGEKIGFIETLIWDTARDITPPSDELREALVAFAAEAVDAYIYGVQKSAAQQLLNADAK